MDLDKFRSLIAGSDSADWNVIECWGAGSGPSYLDQSEGWTRGGNETVGLDIESHAYRAVLRPDLDVGLAWGLDPGDGNLTFDWATWPDPSVYSYLADLLWRGQLVDRYKLLSVDGGRCYLPFPSPSTSAGGIAQSSSARVIAWPVLVDNDAGDRPEIVREEVTPFEVALARLVNDLGGGIHDFDRYLQHAGFEITVDARVS